jgi:hypothetical protein
VRKQLVLDIDLDFFVSPIAHYFADDGPRLPEDKYKVDTHDQVREFLAKQLCLKPGQRIPGRFVRYHKEVFDIWEQLILDGVLKTTFSVFHIDAHDDFSGEGVTGVNSGNFLTHATKRDWLHCIVFVQPPGAQNFPWVYRKFNPLRLCVEEHEVRIGIAEKDTFSMSGFPNPDFLFLTQSPGFTPETADSLIPLIREYINEA